MANFRFAVEIKTSLEIMSEEKRKKKKVKKTPIFNCKQISFLL